MTDDRLIEAQPADEIPTVVEVRLVSWGDGTKGPWIRLQFEHEDQLTPFRPLKTGSANGQRMAISFAFIDDDETQRDLSPTDEKQPEAAGESAGQEAGRSHPQHHEPEFVTENNQRSRLGTARSQECGRFCSDPDFRAFLSDCHPDAIDLSAKAEKPSELAAKAVRKILEVESRTELDVNWGKWQRWCGLMSDYACWQDAQKRKAGQQ